MKLSLPTTYLTLLVFLVAFTADGQLLRTSNEGHFSILRERNAPALRLLEPDAELPTTENPKGLYAGLFFGSSQLNYSFDGQPIALSEISRGGIAGDSAVVMLGDDEATLNPDSKNQRLNLDAGLYLGYFPGFLTFEIGQNEKLALGVMTQLGLSFNGGFGAWLSAGPELMFASGRFAVNAGYSFGWVSTQRKISNLIVKDGGSIIIENGRADVDEDGNIIPFACRPEDYASENSFCRLHNNDSEFYVIGSARTNSSYLRLSYAFSADKKSGIGLVIGHRSNLNPKVRYELWGPHEKIGNQERSALNGPEIQALDGNFGFGGIFFQIEMFTRPF